MDVRPARSRVTVVAKVRHGRGRVLVGSLLAAVVVLAFVAYDRGVVVLQRGHVAVPPATATPMQVAGAFTEALNAHDCATARRLTQDAGSAELWCRDVLALDHVRVATGVPLDPAWSGRRGQQVVVVPVTFDLHWRLFHDDGSMPEGPTVWSYTLARRSAGQPWRIVDQGTG